MHRRFGIPRIRIFYLLDGARNTQFSSNSFSFVKMHMWRRQRRRRWRRFFSGFCSCAIVQSELERKLGIGFSVESDLKRSETGSSIVSSIRNDTGLLCDEIRKLRNGFIMGDLAIDPINDGRHPLLRMCIESPAGRIGDINFSFWFLTWMEQKQIRAHHNGLHYLINLLLCIWFGIFGVRARSRSLFPVCNCTTLACNCSCYVRT